MGLSTQLIFDPTNADTLAASSNVGAYIRSSDGTRITHTVGSGAVRALDVNMINTLNVNVDGDYDAGTNATPDSVGVILHDRNAAPGVAQQNLRSTGGAANADNVVAANVFGADVNSFGMVYDGATWDRLLGTAGAAHVHLASQAANINVNIAAQAAAVTTSDTVNSSFLATAETVDDTAGGKPLPASSLASRKRLTVQNKGAQTIYIGGNGVTTSSGVELLGKSSYEVEAGPLAVLYGIAPAGKTSDVRILEAA